MKGLLYAWQKPGDQEAWIQQNGPGVRKLLAVEASRALGQRKT